MHAHGGRMRMFRITMVAQCSHTAALLALWIATDRSWSGLGFGLDFGTGF